MTNHELRARTGSPDGRLMQHRYFRPLINILRLALASFGVTLAAKGAAVLIVKINGRVSGFDSAVATLLKYPENFPNLFAFFAVVLSFISLSLLADAQLGRWLRSYFLLPALRIAEHMFALSLGIFMAWFFIEWISISAPYESAAKALWMLIYASGLLTALTWLCACIAEFLESDFEAAAKILGNWRAPILMSISITIIAAFSADFIWNYKPIPVSSANKSDRDEAPAHP